MNTYLLVLVLIGGDIKVEATQANLAVCVQTARYKAAQTGNNYGCMPIFLEGPRVPHR